ncbi:MAG: hypothetical protein ACYCYF_02950 [Anaerolineae bacterium]
MIGESFHDRLARLQPRIHGLAIGATLAVGGSLFGQGCPLSGGCVACGGACLPVRLPLLALPLVADAAVMLTGRVAARLADSKPER